ncbi:MAG: DUF4352 domain-containing protein [Planctomycetes bacterium]|nr:DUF4352 domain-containing protein [Planctomycetota bacterium]
MLRWIAVIVICGFVGLAALISLFRHDVRGPLGTTLVYDDFAFTVVGARDESSLLGGKLVPKGVFKVIEVKVANDAKRVDYDVTSQRVVLFDAHGGRYDVDAVAQAALDAALAAPPPKMLHPTESCMTTVVFDVPKGSGYELGITWAGSFFDTVDRLTIGERRVELP